METLQALRTLEYTLAAQLNNKEITAQTYFNMMAEVNKALNALPAELFTK